MNTDLSYAVAQQRRPDVCFCLGEAKPTSEVHSDAAKEANGQDVISGEDCPFIIPNTISYDCNCQWSVHLRERLQKKFPHLLPQLDKTDFTIPVVHVRDHKEDCEYLYAPFYRQGAGHFYGEQAEAPWAEMNQLGGRTRQMGSGHRADVLNEHFSDWNWKKTQGIGELTIFIGVLCALNGSGKAFNWPRTL